MRFSLFNSSDSCASPESDVSKDKKDRKKCKRDSEDSENSDGVDMWLQAVLEGIREEMALFATKDDIKAITEQMNKNAARLDTRMDKLEIDLFDLKNEKGALLTEVKQLREENKTLCGQVDQCQKEAAAFKRDLNDIEQHGRHFNVRVYGVPETEGRT
ncbi:hypothetical protein ACOMHN_050164 [Nucella lapillus]